MSIVPSVAGFDGQQNMDPPPPPPGGPPPQGQYYIIIRLSQSTAAYKGL